MSDLDTETSEESFSPAEQAYFESGGAKVDGLADRPSTPDAGAVTEKPADGKAADAGGAAQDKAPAGDDRFISHGAFHAEREKRKAVEAELGQLRDRWTRTEERQKLLNELIGADKPAGQQDDAPIDPEKDIFGAFKQAVTKIQKLETQLTGTSQKFEQQTADQQIISSYQSDARRFMAQEPNFAQAYNHLLNMRDAELQVLAVSDPRLADKAYRLAIIAGEEKQIVANAARQGKSPAEVMFSLAKARGFTPKQQEQQQKSDAEKQLEAVEKGKAASQSLSGSGGVSPSELTAAQVADMSENEFSEYYEKLSPAARKKLMGG